MKHIKIQIVVCIFSIICLTFPTYAQDDPLIVKVDSTEQLFLDDYVIDSTDNISRHINQAQKNPGGPVLVPDKPWEGDMALL